MEAEVDNVQTEMLFKVLTKWCALSVNQAASRTNARGTAGQLSVGVVLVQHTGVGCKVCSYFGYSQCLRREYKHRGETKNLSSSLNPKALVIFPLSDYVFSVFRKSLNMMYYYNFEAKAPF